MAGHLTSTDKIRNRYKFFYVKREGKILLERPRGRRKSNIKIPLK
jgi:hypothetical protein